jgi:hypothetical protein
VDTCQGEPRLDRMLGKGTHTHTQTHTHTHKSAPVNESRVLIGCLVRVLRISFMGLLMSIFTTSPDNLSADTSGKYFEGSVSSCIFIFKRDIFFLNNYIYIVYMEKISKKSPKKINLKGYAPAQSTRPPP